MSVARVLSPREELFLSSFYNFYQFTSSPVYQFTSLQCWGGAQPAGAEEGRGEGADWQPAGVLIPRVQVSAHACMFRFWMWYWHFENENLILWDFHTSWTLTKTSHMNHVSCVVPQSTVYVIQKQYEQFFFQFSFFFFIFNLIFWFFAESFNWKI